MRLTVSEWRKCQKKKHVLLLVQHVDLNVNRYTIYATRNQSLEWSIRFRSFVCVLNMRYLID